MTMSIRHISLILACFVLGIASGQAQSEDFRKNAPKPGPAPEVQLSEYESMTLENGMQVVVVENKKLPIVSYQLSIDIPMHMEGDNAGLSAMAGQLLRNGTTNRSKAELDEATDFIGASLNASGSGVFASSLTKHKNQLLELMTDVLYNPAFPEDEFAKIKQQTLSGIAANINNPDFISRNVSRVMVYGKDHPYGEVQTQENIENITAEKCRSYYETYFTPAAATLVIVGDISVAEAKKDAQKYFAQWTGSSLEKADYNKPQPPQQTKVDFVDKAGAVQSVVNITYPIYLKPGDDDYFAATVMNTILGGGSNGRLFKNIREDKAYTYGAYSSVSTDEEVGRFSASASVRNEVTDSTIMEFMYELNRMRDEKVGDRELRLAINNIAGSFTRSLESPQRIASFALNTQRYGLPSNYYNNYLKSLFAVTADDVMKVANTYLLPENAHIVVVGNKGDVASNLEQFGSVSYFDAFGNPVENKAAGNDITAEGIIEKYIAAIGGAEKLSAVNDLTIRMSTSVQGMALEVTNEQMNPGMMHMTVKMNGNVMQEVTFDGAKAKVSQMGNAQVVEGEQADAFKSQAVFFPELGFMNDGTKLSLEGVETTGGSDAYKLVVTTPAGQTKTQYYDVASGLKVKEIEVQEAQGQTVTSTQEFSDYQEVDGILFPFQMLSTGAMPFPVNFKVEEVKINSGLETSNFTVE